MVIYEVNLSISAKVKEAFLKWLPSHIDELLKIEGFEAAEVFTDLEPSNSNFNMVVQYQLNNLKVLNLYFEEHSERLKQQAIDLFGNEFTASRRILKKN